MTTTGPATQLGEHRHTVHLEDLRCPGCGEQVIPEPPVNESGAGGQGEFSHPDGTTLCVRADGTVSDPVEVT